MKNLSLTAFLVTLSVPALAEMPRVEPILSVAPVSGPSTEVRICAGAPGGAYHSIASQMLGLVQSAAGMPVSVESCGGTVGSLRKLAAGEAEAAIVQLDGLVWIKDTAPDLYAKIAPAAAVLTEDMIGVCRRDSDYEDLNDIAQKSGQTIAIAGGAESGSLLTFNVLAGFDEDFAAPDYRISGSWEQAMSDVRGGIAICAFGVMSTDAPIWRDLNDDFGDELRIVGFWDGDMRDLELAGRQVYGWRAIPEDIKSLDHLLDWNGEGRLWEPEVGTVPALVIYRTDMLPNGSGPLTDAATAVAKLKPTEE